MRWILWLGLLGCAPKRLTLTMDVPEGLNGGELVPVMVRLVDQATFQREGYPELADLLVSPDVSVLDVRWVRPGERYEVTVRPEQQAVGVYVLVPGVGTVEKTWLEPRLRRRVGVR